jgi:hypothetical protein
VGQKPTMAHKNSGSQTARKARKRRKTRVHLYIDEEVSAVMDELAINKSKFINKVLRTLLFGEEVGKMLIEFWWSRGPDLNRGPADLQSAATPRLGYRGTH